MPVRFVRFPVSIKAVVIFSFLLFICLPGVRAQAIPFKGRVVDFDSRMPLEGITVSIPSLKKSAVTDQQGAFSFLLPVDKLVFFFSSVEYKRVSQTIYIADQESVTIELRKRPPMELPEVIVGNRAKDANVSEVAMSTVNISLTHLRKTPIVFGEADILKALTLQTGISSIGEGAGGFSVRGGNADQNLILLDGAPVFNTSHLLGFYSAVSPESVQDFTLYKGAFPASYGGRLSSLLSLNVRPGNPDSIHFGGSVSPLSLHLFGEGPFVRKSKLTFSADARIAYPKMLMNQFPGSVSQSNAFFYDGVAKLVYRFNPKSQVSLSYYRSYDIFKFPGDTSYAWRSNILALNGKWQLSRLLSLHYAANTSYYASDINGNLSHYEFKLRSSIKHTEAKADLHYQAANHLYFEGGYDFIRYSLSSGELSPAKTGSAINPMSLRKEFGDQMAGYLLGRLDITKQISLEAGIRRSDFFYRGPNTVYQYAAGLPLSTETISDSTAYARGKTITHYGGWEPRILLKIGIDRSTSFKMSYVKMQQYLQLVSNTTAITPVDFWKLSDPLVKPAAADQFTAGVFRNFSNDKVETSLEGFYKHSTDLIDYKDGATLLMNPYVDAGLLAAEGRSYGVELNLRKTKGIITGQLSYTWSRSFIADRTDFKSEEIDGGAFYPSAYDRPSNLSVTGGVKLGLGWDFGWTFVYITGRPATYPDGTYLINNSVVTGYSVRNYDRLPDYNRLDISFSHDSRRYAEQKKYCIINFSLYNIYAKKNPYSIYFQRSGTRLDAYELSVLGTIIPSMTLSYYF